MKIAIVGLGAIGVSLAKNLTQSGVEVVGFTRHPVKAYQIKEKSGTSTLEIAAHAEPRKEHMGAFDLVVFTLKNHVLAQQLARYLPLLNATGCILCAQNGVMEYFIAEHFPKDRILGCLVKGNSIYTPPDRIEIAMPIEFIVGPMVPEAMRHPSVQTVLDILEKAAFGRTVTDIVGFKWSKLVFSAMVNPLSAATGLDAHKLLQNSRAVKIGLGIIDEVIAVADREGVKLARDGVISPYYFRKNGGAPMILKKLLIKLFSLTLRGVKVSMLQDIELGRTTEVDYINGSVVELSSKHGLSAPFNKRTRQIIKDLERRELTPSLENLSLYGNGLT